ncbi:hypothetical protein [Palleronia sp.]|uniref:hypothetical protein n=1 Tax=Palleronia sp. TaxID=1940284 RepID=UPI0035C7E014
MIDKTKANPKKKPRGGWLKNPQEPRKGEVIGGGHFVFRRGGGTNRIRPAMWPFEHGTAQEAQAEAAKLAAASPGETFLVVSEVFAITREDLVEADAA